MSTQREFIQGHFCRAMLMLLCVHVLGAPPALAQWKPPDALQDRVMALDEAEIAFLTSGAVLEFMPERQLEYEIGRRDAAGLQRLLGDLMALADEMGYNAERDMGAIPLNLSSRRFNSGTLPTPAPLRKLDREPGPFSVHRYLLPRSGVPTFAGAKVAIWPEDLVAGDVDVAIIGVPSNMSSGRRDAGAGPTAMRALNTIAAPDGQSLVDPMATLAVVDYGDFAVDNFSAERSVAHVSAMVAETVRTGAIPMLVGGDTSMLYPGVRGVAEALGSATFGLLHLGAHPDVERFDDHTISDDQALFALLEQGIVRGSDTIQLGLRGAAVTEETLAWLRSRKVRYHTMAEVHERGFERVLKSVRAELARGPERFFVSIDVSVLDPAEMVAAGRIETSGLRVQQVTRAIRHACASKQIVGFEVTDLAPMLDVSRLSVLNANALLNACLVGVALRKAGLAPDFIHPLVLSHGQR